MLHKKIVNVKKKKLIFAFRWKKRLEAFFDTIKINK